MRLTSLLLIALIATSFASAYGQMRILAGSSVGVPFVPQFTVMGGADMPVSGATSTTLRIVSGPGNALHYPEAVRILPGYGLSLRTGRLLEAQVSAGPGVSFERVSEQVAGVGYTNPHYTYHTLFSPHITASVYTLPANRVSVGLTGLSALSATGPFTTVSLILAVQLGELR